MSSCNDEAITGLELLVTIFIIVVIAGFLLFSLGEEGSSSDTGPGHHPPFDDSTIGQTSIKSAA
jgi:hypothetical protein